jgi:phosphoglycolate phosphatase-like HAD superfamily hydrolase
LRKPRALILDFDGVLLESNDAKTIAFRELAARYPEHRDAMMAYHFAHQSAPRARKFEYFCGECLGQPGNVALLEELEREFSRLVVARVMACAEVPGARAFLEEFSAVMPVYLSSATPHAELLGILKGRGLDHFFADIYGDPPHPKTFAVASVMAREQLDASELLFIGDAESDLRAASEAGVPFIGRDSGLLGDLPCERYADMADIARVVRVRVS